jgi:hypothetical protein
MSYVSGWSDSLPLSQTGGASDVAQAIEREANGMVVHVRLSGAPNRNRAISALQTVLNRRGMLGTFDGIRTFDRSFAVLLSMPDAVPPPDISVDPDGEVAMDWSADDDMFSLSVGASGRLTFAAYIDGREWSGEGFFGNSLPEDVLDAVQHFS